MHIKYSKNKYKLYIKKITINNIYNKKKTHYNVFFYYLNHIYGNYN